MYNDDDDDESSLPSFETDANNIGFCDIASSLVRDDNTFSTNLDVIHSSQKYGECPPENSSPFGLYSSLGPDGSDVIEIKRSSDSLLQELLLQSQTSINLNRETLTPADTHRIMSRETIVEEFTAPTIINNASQSFDLSQAKPAVSEKSVTIDAASTPRNSPSKISIRRIQPEDRCFSNFDFTMCGTDNSVSKRTSFPRKYDRDHRSICTIS